MAIQDDIRTDLQTEVFDEIGKTVTLKNKSTPVYNDRGEIINYDVSSTDIVIVPYNITDKEQEFVEQGNNKGGEMEAAVPYDITFSIDDIIVMDGVNWLIKRIEPNYLPDNVVTIVRIVREI